MSAPAEVRGVFGRFSASGIFFQGGAAAIDTGTIVATLVHGLTGGSALAVGAAATIARAGWLLPQLVVGYVAQHRARRMPFYVIGAFGRAICLAALAGLLWLGAGLSGDAVVAVFFVVWTLYAFVGGIVRCLTTTSWPARSRPTGAADCWRSGFSGVACWRCWWLLRRTRF